MSVTAGVSDAIIAIREKLRGKIGQTKVKRYWPGKAPEWADEPEEDSDLRTTRSTAAAAAASLEHAFPSGDIKLTDDPRLRRLAKTRASDKDEIRADHRRVRQAEIVSAEEEAEKEEEDDEDEDAVEERRRRIRERGLEQRRDEEVELPTVEEEEEDEEDEEESESEYETDSDEEADRRAMMKPVFVPKAERETIAEREKVEAAEREAEEREKRREAERRIETKQIVVEKIREDLEIQRSFEAEADIGDVETDDELNEAEEYEAWKAREIARIKRDREDKEARLKGKDETEKTRIESSSNNSNNNAAQKKKLRFLQKYYHKGVFYQAEADDRAGTAGSDEIYKRDFSEPTGEDKLNKTILPKVMQVKHFGRSGRTKWTHLVNEDTTDWTTPWANNDPLRSKYDAKMAGMNKPIAKPKGSKKLKDWEQS